MAAPEKICVSSVKLTALPASPDGELSDTVYRKCFFCEKDCQVEATSRAMSDRLAGPGRFYCPFCLRHGYNTRNSRHVLILSFRSVFGYFFHHLYAAPQGHHVRRMYLADIQDYIDAHEQVGLMNPVFNYDPDTLLWFVDFSRVGQSKRKIPVSAVQRTILDILTCFNLTETAPAVSQAGLYAKYKEAVAGFYERRYRPPDRRMLIPTLLGNDNKTRAFTCRDMCAKK